MRVLSQQLFAGGLLLLLLLQSFSREVLVVNYALNKGVITARFCVNKARPMLQCEGKCYFAQQLKKQQQRQDQAPSPLKTRLEMLPVGVVSLVPPRPAGYPASIRPFFRRPAPALCGRGQWGVFHPPKPCARPLA